MSEDFVNSILDEVMKSIDSASATPAAVKASKQPAATCALTEFVGTAIGHTIGMVIANLDPQVQEKFEIPAEYRAIGIVGSRCGAAPQIFAADEAVKATSSRVVRVEMARDMEGGAGHGCLIIFGAADVSDARRAVEVCLQELDNTFGEVYTNAAGHLQFQYTARASFALNKAFGAEIGKSFGMTVGAPAAIGVLMADTAVKAAALNIVKVGTPGNGGTSFSNEVAVAFSGDSGAVKQAVMSARDVGMQLLQAMVPGEEIKSAGKPYIL